MKLKTSFEGSKIQIKEAKVSMQWPLSTSPVSSCFSIDKHPTSFNYAAMTASKGTKGTSTIVRINVQVNFDLPNLPRLPSCNDERMATATWHSSLLRLELKVRFFKVNANHGKQHRETLPQIICKSGLVRQASCSLPCIAIKVCTLAFYQLLWPQLSCF